MADRRIGEQPFQILFENSNERAEDEGDEPRRRYEPQPLISPSQRRPEPDQKEDTSLHHGGRMKVSRDWRRRRHRVRQPEMKWELRALRQSADKDEDEG